MVTQKQMQLCFGLISIFHYLSMYLVLRMSRIRDQLDEDKLLVIQV